MCYNGDLFKPNFMHLEYVCADPDAVRESATLLKILAKFNAAKAMKARRNGGIAWENITTDRVFADYALACEVWEFAKQRLTAKFFRFEQLTAVIKETLGQIRTVDVNRKIPAEEVCERITYFGLKPALDYMLSTNENRGTEFMGSIHSDYTAALKSINEGDLQLLEQAVADKLIYIVEIHRAFQTGEPTFEKLIENLRAAAGKKAGGKETKPADSADPACRPGLCA